MQKLGLSGRNFLTTSHSVAIISHAGNLLRPHKSAFNVIIYCVRQG